MAHVELLLRDLPAFQHTEHRSESSHLHLGEPELFCSPEVLCKHSAPRNRPTKSPAHGYTRSNCGRELLPARIEARPIQILLTVVGDDADGSRSLLRMISENFRIWVNASVWPARSTRHLSAPGAPVIGIQMMPGTASSIRRHAHA